MVPSLASPPAPVMLPSVHAMVPRARTVLGAASARLWPRASVCAPDVPPSWRLRTLTLPAVVTV